MYTRLPNINTVSTRRGFTLIEVIVAIAIFSIMSFGCYRIVNGIVSSRDRIQMNSDELTQLARAIRILDRDFQQMVNRSILDENGQNLPAFMAETFQSGHNGIKVEFTRQGVRNPLFSKRAEIIRVGYGIQSEIHTDEFGDSIFSEKTGNDSNKNKSEYLIRYVWPVLDRGNIIKPEQQVLLSHVSAFEVEYLDKNKNWVLEWPPLGEDPSKSSILPYAVRIKIDTLDNGLIERIFASHDLPENK